MAMGLIAAAATFLIISTSIQNSVLRVIISGHFPSDTQVTISSIDEKGEASWTTAYITKANASQRPQATGTQILNLPLEKLRIDLLSMNSGTNEASDNESTDQVFLNNIQTPMPYSIDYFFGSKQIPLFFNSDQAVDGSNGQYRFDPETQKIRLESMSNIGDPNPFFVIGMALLFGLGVWLLVKNSFWINIPAFSDMSLGNLLSNSAEFNAINGVRGLAALLVLLSHTAPGFESIQMGLALLFVISGFLLSKPFVIDRTKICSWANIESYFTKRLKRILPMYYLFVFITYVLTFKFGTAMRHFLFVQAEGHLWPMTQIFTFYMLLPLVLLLTCFAQRIHRLLPIALLSIASYLWITTATSWTPYFNGEYSHPFFLYTFLIGVLASYFYYDLILNSVGLQRWLKRYGFLIAVLSALITFFGIAWSAPLKPPDFVLHYISQFYIKSILSAAIIVFALLVPTNWFARLISNWLFRSIGVVGFSFYLLHGLGMQIALKLDQQVLHTGVIEERSWALTLTAFAVTYIMAIFSYSYVERPFFGYRRGTH